MGLAMSGWIPMADTWRVMRINLVYASAYQKPEKLTIDSIKDVAPTWGSWKTWRAYETDNVICHDLGHARELLQRSIQTTCNLYLPEKFYAKLSRPDRINFYSGDFVDDAQDIEDVVAMHLVRDSSDLVLLMGFDLANQAPVADPLLGRRIKHRLGLIRSCVANSESVQWVLIDHNKDLDRAFQGLPNLTCDSFQNMLQLLV